MNQVGVIIIPEFNCLMVKSQVVACHDSIGSRIPVNIQIRRGVFWPNQINSAKFYQVDTGPLRISSNIQSTILVKLIFTACKFHAHWKFKHVRFALSADVLQVLLLHTVAVLRPGGILCADELFRTGAVQSTVWQPDDTWMSLPGQSMLQPLLQSMLSLVMQWVKWRRSGVWLSWIMENVSPVLIMVVICLCVLSVSVYCVRWLSLCSRSVVAFPQLNCFTYS